MAVFSRKRLKRKLSTRLIYSPFIRLLVFNAWFRLAFGGFVLVAVFVALYLPKIWVVSPDQFLPEVKVSGLDLTQNWALKRSARKAQTAGDFKRASQSWEAAVAQNPADVPSLRGYLANCLNLEKADRTIFRSAVSQMSWLFRLANTNSTDVELAARVCEKFRWNDVAVYLLGNIHQPISPLGEAIYLKALFQVGRMAEFQRRYQMVASKLNDGELAIYQLALKAASPADPSAKSAETHLEQLSNSGDNATLATRLHMVACGEKGNLPGYAQSLQKLALRNEDNVSDHATYWVLLISVGRKDEAVKLAESFTRAPGSAVETVRLAEAYFQLGMLDASREVLHKFAPDFHQSPEVWVAYAAVLDKQGDWSELRAIALQIREDLNARDSLWGFAYFLEGRAELAEKRLDSAARAFERAAESAYEIPPLGAAVARELTKLKFPQLALDVYKQLEDSFQSDLRFWEGSFEAAFATHNAGLVLKASERCFQLNPRDAQACNRYAAALIINRKNPEEVVRLTLQLLTRYPNSVAGRLNHTFALLMNHRTSEAKEILEGIDPDSLSAPDANSYYLARFELSYALQKWDDAASALDKISRGTLFPEQRQWLKEKHEKMPPRQVATVQ
jgi:tetratricopeptide (TPR) repeat protein